MGSFLSFILITIFVIWLIGLVGRLLLRAWIVKKQRQFAEQFGPDAQYKQNGWTRAAGGSFRGDTPDEGEVRVRQTMPVEKKVSKVVGDYVEFEEEITDTE